MYFEKVQEKIGIDKVDLGCGSQLSGAVSPLSCYYKDEVPKKEPRLDEGKYSEQIPEDRMHDVYKELMRNVAVIGEDGSSSSGEKILKKYTSDYLKLCRKKSKARKDEVLANKDLEGGLSLYRSKMKSVGENGFATFGEDGKISWVSYKRRSRYFKEGRDWMISKLFHRYKKMSVSKSGVLLTLTYDQKKIDIWDAWKNVGEHCRVFMKNLNRIRKRHYKRLYGEGVERKNLSFFRVVEFHKNGYPHVHYYFPGLKWLWHHSKGKRGSVKNSHGKDIKGLFDIWKWGRTEVKPTKGGGRLSNYVTKYLRKFDSSNELAMMYMWLTETKIFTFSNDFREEPGELELRGPRFELLGNCGWKEFKKLLIKAWLVVKFSDISDYVESESGDPPGKGFCYETPWKYSRENLVDVGFFC